MRFYSTRDKSVTVSFSDAVMGGMNSSGGLFMPQSLPRLSEKEIRGLTSASLAEIAMATISPFTDGDLSNDELAEVIDKAFNFPLVLKRISTGLSVLELFHGPTCAFKDFGARFMAQTMAKLNSGRKGLLHILVATSGDTGSAVGNAFLGLDGFRVTILYPKGRISTIQEKQLSTFDGNVRAIAVNGSFDDCQSMVKTAFTDADLRDHVNLSSANSINIARLLPQACYYAWAGLELSKEDNKAHVTAIVPSGNFGNLTAGLLSAKMGFPLDSFIAATNSNSTVPDYLREGVYRPRESISTISNAMDVGAPSNFERMADMYDLGQMRTIIDSISVNDINTRQAMRMAYRSFDYVLEPHGGVAYYAYDQLAPILQKRKNEKLKASLQAFILETAHPAKFSETIKEELGINPELPERISSLLSLPDRSIPMEAEYNSLRDYLLSE